MKDTKLVYSTDPTLNRCCPQCKEVIGECTCRKDEPLPKEISAVLRLEKKGRGGKSVTVLAKLPRSQAFLKDLTQKLKKRCGVGGTWYVGESEGVVEIQGEKMAEIRQTLAELEIKCKG